MDTNKRMYNKEMNGFKQKDWQVQEGFKLTIKLTEGSTSLVGSCYTSPSSQFSLVYYPS